MTDTRGTDLLRRLHFKTERSIIRKVWQIPPRVGRSRHVPFLLLSGRARSLG